MLQALSPQFRCFRLLFTSAGGEYFLTLGGVATGRLPTVDIEQDQPLGPQIQNYCNETWLIRCDIVDILICGNQSGLIILRLHKDMRDAFLFPFRLQHYEDLPLFHFSRYELDALKMLHTKGETGRGPFSRLNWLDDVRSWLSEVLTCPPEGFEITQCYVSPNRVISSIQTNTGEKYWLKGAAPTEARLVRLLAHEAPHYVPDLVAHHDSLGVWLTNHMGSPLSEKENITERDVVDATTRLAQLQKRTSQIIPALRAAVPSLETTEDLLKAFGELLLGDNEVTRHFSISSFAKVKQIEDVSSSLSRILTLLADLRLPAVLIHDDLYGGNILFATGRLSFTDWEEAHLGTPFENAEHLSLLAHTGRHATPVELAYRSVWEGTCDLATIRRGIALSQPLAIAVRLLRLLQRHGEEPCNTFSLPRHSVRIMFRQLHHSLRLTIE